ncbi:MAG: coenzyme F420-0:L-glutamate ligase / coenzyme F420:gamma-L-glutamate ligase [Thermoproteota archaeon]|nr:coenzyme F420-0:L-glutamate ligase / coenzyme F420:gamma-L-glutamate ligase [Thermoproteota archaeon]
MNDFNGNVQIIGIKRIPMIKVDDDLGNIIKESAEKQSTPVSDGDIIVVTQKIVSKAEGRIIRLKDVQPSTFAKSVSKITGKEPELIELILGESRSIVRLIGPHLITETKHGWVCANAGIDKSNVSGGDSVTLLPVNPDHSADRIRKRIESLTGKKVAVIVTDTFGRPLREGHVDVAIGVSGIDPILDMRGEKDIFGFVLKVKETAIADELASAAELVIGNAKEQIPVAIIRGYKYPFSDTARARKLIRPKAKDLFI